METGDSQHQNRGELQYAPIFGALPQRVVESARWPCPLNREMGTHTSHEGRPQAETGQEMVTSDEADTADVGFTGTAFSMPPGRGTRAPSGDVGTYSSSVLGATPLEVGEHVTRIKPVDAAAQRGPRRA